MVPKIAILFLAATLLAAAASADGQRPSMSVMRPAGSYILRTKPTKEQKEKLRPLQQDLDRYDALLRRPRTGIFRLFPDLGCSDNVNIVRADAQCAETFVESSYYSFREKEHTIRMLADIRLRNDYLITDGVLSQGIIADLGDVDIENVTLAPGAGLEFLTEFTPRAEGLEAQRQYIELMRGIKVGGYRFAKSAEIKENSTYALRVIAYRGSLFRSFRGFRIDILEGDKRIDLTVAFRVVRKSADGVATLVWREISRRESPRIVYPKPQPKPKQSKG